MTVAQEYVTTIDDVLDELKGEQQIGEFVETFMRVARLVTENARLKGFHNAGLTKGDRYALMHSELSEGFECARAVEVPMSEKCPGFTHEVEELADLIIRAMDFAVVEGMPLAEAILAKAVYNTSRPYMHGKKL